MADLIDRDAAILAFSDYAEIKEDLDDYREILENIPAVNRWISFSERLPEKSGQYLVCAIYVGVSLACFDRDKSEWGYWQDDPCGWYGEKWIEIDEVTHWMPLPEPPEKE